MARVARTAASPILAALVAAALLFPPAGTAAAAGDPVPVAPGDGVAPASAGSGGIAINGTTAATRDATVTVTVPPPTGAAGMLRLSNDGGATWLERPWATAFAWSLTDPAAGGTDEDGLRTVSVETGDGLGTWTPMGRASILLDRAAPETVLMVTQTAPGAPTAWVEVQASETGVGVARTEVSLDGEHWRSLTAYDFFMPGFVDLREGTIGGSWLVGDRTVYGRAVDKVGNVGESVPVTLTVTELSRPGTDDLPATYEFPLPAVTGSPFTIRPVFDAGYTIPAGQFCQWTLTWGTAKVRLLAGFDETYGMVRFSVAPNASRHCSAWTFTLPYSRTLEYSFSLTINDGVDTTVYVTSPVSGSFRATLGTTERAIRDSNLPLYYVLPDADVVGSDGTVTYRLHPAGGAAFPVPGWWFCQPAEHESGPGGYQPQDQYGGSAFTCRVTSTGPWVAYWARETATRMWRAGYDPVGDRKRPVVTSVHPQVAPVAPTTLGMKARVVWTGYDKGSGIRSWQLQVSRDGGGWRTVTPTSPLAKSADVPVAFGHAYRFRVRGRDRAGNTGAWMTSASVRPQRRDDRSTLVRYGSGWTTVDGGAAIGTGRHTTSTAGAWARLDVTGRAVAWVAGRGPGKGFAQVIVDGVLSATVDLRAAVDGPPVVVWRRSWGSVASHVVRIRVLGTIGRPAVDLDGFLVLR